MTHGLSKQLALKHHLPRQPSRKYCQLSAYKLLYCRLLTAPRSIVQLPVFSHNKVIVVDPCLNTSLPSHVYTTVDLTVVCNPDLTVLCTSGGSGQVISTMCNCRQREYYQNFNKI